MYKKVFFEISGKCQASCPYCCSGNKSLKTYSSRFIPVEEFLRAVKRIFELGLISVNTRFELYNWGEPFLHPNLLDILQVLVDHNLKYRLSTNAAKYKRLSEQVAKNCDELTITIPGFSQKSYDRVHGLNFQRILDNIDKFIMDISSEKIRITYLVHQFNIDEINDAYTYFSNRNIKMTHTIAYMNDYNMARDFLAGNLSNEQLYSISKELLLYYINDMVNAIPDNYICPQFSILALNEYCEVLTCCAAPKDNVSYSLGSIFDLTAGQINQKKRQQLICTECQKLGIHYWIHTSPNPKFWWQIIGKGAHTIRTIDLLKLLCKRAINKLNFINAHF